MRTWELSELWRCMADLMELEGKTGPRVQAYRDTARWAGGDEDLPVGLDASESPAGEPPAGRLFLPEPFEYVEAEVPDEEGVLA